VPEPEKVERDQGRSTQSGPGSGPRESPMKASLRGMRFAEGEKALTPAPVQRKPGPEGMSGAKPAPGGGKGGGTNASKPEPL